MMTEFIHDKRPMIYFFYEILSGIALRWCMRLNNSKIKKQRDLMDIFIKQYKFNMFVEDRSSLQIMEKGPKELI